MITFNQFTIAISLIVIAITLIIGIVLLSATTSKINRTLKYNNQLLESINRPFLTVFINKNTLMIKNTGKTQAILDDISINDNEISVLSDISINPKQVISTRLETSGKIEIKYHSKINSYQENIDL
ncbi:hypothetical protein [Companilactobacillus keshanensis]|uniref:Uncharacterized protein n=1 Tax=Companilactobacillus keshanensis TaxID=2486003 RepID=A0ABW4BUR7_9LACO|nr:hypothetical protein [Companilactobacillus keshanensis]